MCCLPPGQGAVALALIACECGVNSVKCNVSDLRQLDDRDRSAVSARHDTDIARSWRRQTFG
jgi:hypothetical protein